MLHAALTGDREAVHHGRPTATAVAPRPSAFTTSTPERTPESNTTGAPSAASTTGSRHSIAGMPPFACRPPWFEQTMPSIPPSSARFASSGSQTPFSRIGSEVSARNRARSSQVIAGSPNSDAQSRTAASSPSPPCSASSAWKRGSVR